WAMDPGANYRYQCDTAFPLSDHADFPDLLAFVDRVQPKRVFTVHGFAQEFARTLRERGIEAWALGEANQLDLGLAATAVAVSTPSAAAVPVKAPPAEAGSFAEFADVATRVAGTGSKLGKIALLQEYLARLPVDAAVRAAIYFTGRAFPQADPRTLNVGAALLRKAVIEASGATEADFRAAYARFRDTGETVAALLAFRARPGPPRDLRQIGDELAALASARGPLEKLDRLKTLFAQLSPLEAKYAAKIITGDLRIGLKEGLVEEAIAAVAGRTIGEIREANLLCGDLGLVLRAALAGRLADITLQPFRPLQFMLATPEPTAEAILERLQVPIWLEEKYDGIRCQIHKVGRRVELFSRDLHNITAQFPDLAAAATGLAGDFIADGELLAWREGRALPFAELQKRLGRRGDDLFLGAEIPVSLSLYDLLWCDGSVLLKQPLQERRARLDALVPAGQAKIHLAPVTQVATAVEIEAAFLRARERGNEGLMAKDPQSAYTPGRRGQAWLKLKKAYATLDVVVVAVEYGHGKRRDVLSDYTFAVRDDASGTLLTVGKAYSGLTDVEIAALTTHFLEQTLEEKGRVRLVRP
ncbi:MAG TPA: ATP-dependent DNA ligase, partial [Lacunisphaera sp.]|nr:ATP-dependent DNA ligase [Lacunisphaera sp.]